MFLSLLAFAIGLALLLFSGNLLSRSTLRCAILFGVSPLVTGLTITALATSMPEAMVGVNAAFHGSTDIIIGNVVGSNIANILLVLGVPALFISLKTNILMARVHFIVMSFASLLLFAIAFLGGLSHLSAMVFLALLAFWLFFSFKKSPKVSVPDEQSPTPSFFNNKPLPIVLFFVALATGGLWMGAEMMVYSAQEMAQAFGISQAVIALTLIAIGTSLPEFAASLAAIMHKQSDIALGNILGSNIMNIFFVMGLSAFITPIIFSQAFLTLDLPVMIGAVILIAPFILWKHSLNIWAGLLFLASYGLYIWSLEAIRYNIH